MAQKTQEIVQMLQGNYGTTARWEIFHHFKAVCLCTKRCNNFGNGALTFCNCWGKWVTGRQTHVRIPRPPTSGSPDIGSKAVLGPDSIKMPCVILEINAVSLGKSVQSRRRLSPTQLPEISEPLLAPYNSIIIAYYETQSLPFLPTNRQTAR